MNTKCLRQIAGESSLQNLEMYNYPNNITEQVNLSEKNEPEYELQKHIVHVTSKSRDLSMYKSSSNFKVSLPDTYTNVTSVKLLGGILPNLDGIANSAYILMDIKEINSIKSTENSSIFAVLQLLPHTNAAFQSINNQCCDWAPCLFYPEKSVLSTLTITLKHPDGTIVVYPNETSISEVNQSSFIFEITTKIPKRLQTRNNRIPVHHY